VRDVESFVDCPKAGCGEWVLAINGVARACDTHYAMKRRRIRSGRQPRPGWYRQAMERSGRRCVACGSNDELTIDHIIRTSDGGSNSRDNLQVLCRDCHDDKETLYDRDRMT